jgi:hypothetical protein
MADPKAADVMYPRRIGVREFRANMTGYLRQARRGTTFLITEDASLVSQDQHAAEYPVRVIACSDSH